MQTVTVLTVEALKRAVQDGVQRIVIGSPRLGADILRTVGARPAMAAAPASGIRWRTAFLLVVVTAGFAMALGFAWARGYLPFP